MVAPTSVLLINNMERNLPRDRFISLRKKVITSTFLAASLSVASSGFSMDGHEPTHGEIYPQDIFTPIIIPESDSPDKKIMPHSSIIIEFITPIPVLSQKEKQDLEIKQELEQVVGIMQNHSDIFSDKYINDLKMYYPIYKVVADKFDIDWYLLFIVHENETGASAGEKGFAPESYYIGAMQRDPNIWDKDYVNKAAKGLEDLAKLPQRHKDDWREIAAAASMLSDNFYEYKSRGDSKNDAVKKALLRYSAEEPARTRFELYKQYSQVFENEAEIFIPIKLNQ